MNLLSLGLGGLNLSTAALLEVFPKREVDGKIIENIEGKIGVVSSLEHIYLRENINLSDDVVYTLSEFTPSLSLKYLNLSACGITHAGY